MISHIRPVGQVAEVCVCILHMIIETSSVGISLPTYFAGKTLGVCVVLINMSLEVGRTGKNTFTKGATVLVESFAVVIKMCL